jgi:NAD(P)-dependent dehydrogenase (short-subunit alcohol dehydrogenase family)
VQVSLVTGGGGRGIGSAVCRALAGGQFAVAVGDRDIAAAEAVAAMVAAAGGSATALHLDVADDASVQAAVKATLDLYGRIDVLVNSAGQGLVQPLADVGDTDYDRVLGVDLKGAFLCCRAVLPVMVAAGRGSIVNVGSNHALSTIPGFGVYAAAKAGLAGLTRGIATDYGRHGIRCNVVHPGLVDGPLNRELLADAYGDADAWMSQWLGTRQMLPNPIEADDIGAVVAFLASDASRAITGAEIVADAGTSAMLIDYDRKDPA